MEKRKEIKRQTFDLTVPDLFMLNSTHKLKGYDKYRHEKGGADLFVSYSPFVEEWNHEPIIGNDRADRGMKIGEQIIYFEVDRGTEGLKVINEKLESYMNYADRSRERFCVVFSIIGTDREVANRGDNLMALFASKKRGNQFLAGNHTNILNHPFGEVLYSPLDGVLSLSALE